uniref:RING-type domain-containing protein n=1 Tax=Cannabis sativa TaxID=3483 RepID=A0ABL6UXX9_CANSA
MDGPPENDCCAVCHGSFNIPCQANCSHWFCGGCIMLVWHHGSALQPCKCPLCRREITLLVPSEASLRQRHENDAEEVLGKIERYNRYFAGRTLGLFQTSRPSFLFTEVVTRTNGSSAISPPCHKGTYLHCNGNERCLRTQSG